MLKPIGAALLLAALLLVSSCGAESAQNPVPERAKTMQPVRFPRRERKDRTRRSRRSSFRLPITTARVFPLRPSPFGETTIFTRTSRTAIR